MDHGQDAAPPCSMHSESGAPAVPSARFRGPQPPPPPSAEAPANDATLSEVWHHSLAVTPPSRVPPRSVVERASCPCRGIRCSCTARSPTHPTRPETRERAAPARIAELNNCAILSILTRQFPAPLSWRPALGLRAGATDQRQALQVVQLAQSAGCTGGGRVSQDSQKRCHTS